MFSGFCLISTKSNNWLDQVSGGMIKRRTGQESEGPGVWRAHKTQDWTGI